MFRKSGIELCREIKVDPELRATPVIMLPARTHSISWRASRPSFACAPRSSVWPVCGSRRPLSWPTCASDSRPWRGPS